jgi:hypothetical protein
MTITHFSHVAENSVDRADANVEMVVVAEAGERIFFSLELLVLILVESRLSDRKRHLAFLQRNNVPCYRGPVT